MGAREGADTASVRTMMGGYLSFGHGGLVRRPLRGGWDGLGAPGYHTASGPAPRRPRRCAGRPHALDRLLVEHVRAHGPSSRFDLSWWAGIGLTVVDEVLDRLNLEGMTGPDGRTYLDPPDPPSATHVWGGAAAAGIRRPDVRLPPAGSCALQ